MLLKKSVLTRDVHRFSSLVHIVKSTEGPYFPMLFQGYFKATVICDRISVLIDGMLSTYDLIRNLTYLNKMI